MKKIPGADRARAIATKLRLRINKALKKVPPEALTQEPHPDPEKETEILDRALKALPKIALEELHKRVYRDPSKEKTVGDTVFIPFIGSEREEAGLDVKTTAFSVEKYEEMQKSNGATCDKCFGWGTVGTRNRKCTRCKGTGRR